MRVRALRGALTPALVLLLALGGAVLTAAFFYVRLSLQPLAGTVRIPRLDSAVTVYLDDLAIPHVYAATLEDAFRAQGYLHASERLWQMELLRRTGSGRLAELFGEPALETDRFVRTLDLWGAAERSLAALPPSERRLLEAYAEGVNARIDSWSGPWPPEMLLLGVEPDPWDPLASVAVGKVMALDLTTWRPEISRLLAFRELDSARYEYLRPEYPGWGPTIVPGEAAPAESTPPGSGPPSGSLGSSGTRPDAAAAARAGASRVSSSGAWDPLDYLSGFGLGASNSWAVSGRRAARRRPLLASDMHLPLRAPSIWYLVALHGEEAEYHVAGLSIPGAPGVVVGYNRGIAWAFTNGMVDDADFVIEEEGPGGTSYRDGSSWRRFETRVEKIVVRGRDEPVRHAVRQTVRGPVISDVLPGIGATLSILWTGRLATTEVVGLLRMNRAVEPRAFQRAIRGFDSPHQNVIYATADGELGYRLSGTIPRREGWNGARPIPSGLAPRGWSGFWPADSFPATRRPSGGFLASANNLQRRDLFGRVGTDYPLPFRARRIVDRLAAEAEWTIDGFRDLQRDTYSLMAERLVGRAAAAARRVEAPAVASRLEAWDLRVSLDSREATVFHVWLYRLRDAIAADELEGLGEWALFPDGALLRTLEEGGGPWVDDVRTDSVETLGALEEEAMRVALPWADRPWGEVHEERSAHPLGRVRWLEWIFGFDVGPYPGRGGPHTVRPDDPRRWTSLDSAAWRPPFASDYGPSERFVAEMAPDESVGWFLLPTGQSGNPLSSHYRDMQARWRDADLVPIPLDREAARGRAVRTLQLFPARAQTPVAASSGRTAVSGRAVPRASGPPPPSEGDPDRG